jgi:cohesin complex subunit SA-1/2
LESAVDVVHYLNQATSLSHTNETKFQELQDNLVSSLRKRVVNKDIQSAVLEDEEVEELSGCTRRIAFLIMHNNISLTLINEGEDGGEAKALVIISALADRCRLGYREEEEVCLGYLFEIC